MAPRASVILSTYNQPRLLDLALHSYARQSCMDFELLIADDGSGEETTEVIDRHAGKLGVPLARIWQPNEGFRKAMANNRAALESRSQCLIFSDGDCLASRTFVEEHLQAARPNRYCVGGHIRLSEESTRRIHVEDVTSGSFESTGTLWERLGLWGTHAKSLAYIAVHKRRKPKFYGLNFSVDRESFFRVNGFDNSYQNSARDDSDLRNRMQLAGVRPRSLWHRARVYHLHHPPHTTRLGWRGAAEYYNRPDLEPAARSGLREIAQESATPIGREEPRRAPPFRSE
jgi:glycosyltransferase involved in cell wall biosynthesis